MNKPNIDIVLKHCRDSYNGHYPAEGYDELTNILKFEFNKKNKFSDPIIELGPAYTLLPVFILKNIGTKYVATDPFLSDRTVHAIKYIHSLHGINSDNYKIYKKDALSFFQKFPDIKGIIVSSDVLNSSVITLPDTNSLDYKLVNQYTSELAKNIYDATPENGFTAHIFIDDFFSEKLLEAGFKHNGKYLFQK